nr:hypothetical protein [Tessaracoccus sp.]
MAINGLHIHTGIDARAKALPIVYGLARFAPYFIALSGSRRTGWVRTRASPPSGP